MWTGPLGSRAALRWAIRQAEVPRDSVEAVIAWQFPAATSGYGLAQMVAEDSVGYHEELATKQLQSAITEELEPTCRVPLILTVLEGAAAEVLVDAADGTDFLVVGSRGHGGFTGMLLGSVSQHCARHAHCPVAIIRDPIA